MLVFYIEFKSVFSYINSALISIPNMKYLDIADEKNFVGIRLENNQTLWNFIIWKIQII